MTSILPDPIQSQLPGGATPPISVTTDVGEPPVPLPSEDSPARLSRATSSRNKGKTPVRPLQATSSSSSLPASFKDAKLVLDNHITRVTDLEERLESHTATVQAHLVDFAAAVSTTEQAASDVAQINTQLRTVEGTLYHLQKAHENMADRIDDLQHNDSTILDTLQSIKAQLRDLNDTRSRNMHAPVVVSSDDDEDSHRRKRPRTSTPAIRSQRPPPKRVSKPGAHLDPQPPTLPIDGSAAPAPIPTAQPASISPAPPANSTIATMGTTNPTPLPTLPVAPTNGPQAPEFGVRVGPIDLTGHRDFNKTALTIMKLLARSTRLSFRVRGRRDGANFIMMTWRSDNEAIAFYTLWHEETPVGYEGVSVSLCFQPGQSNL
jgi:hypothetical protein